MNNTTFWYYPQWKRERNKPNISMYLYTHRDMGTHSYLPPDRAFTWQIRNLSLHPLPLRGVLFAVVDYYGKLGGSCGNWFKKSH